MISWRFFRRVFGLVPVEDFPQNDGTHQGTGVRHTFLQKSPLKEGHDMQKNIKGKAGSNP